MAVTRAIPTGTAAPAAGAKACCRPIAIPDEFDGIIAGDPANVRRNAWALWLAVQTFKDPAAYIPPEKYPMIHRAVLDACDANDGLKDGLIEDPESCHVDFKALQCKGVRRPRLPYAAPGPNRADHHQPRDRRDRQGSLPAP